jgi:hypothetical protein
MVELAEFKLVDVLPRFPEFNQKVWARGVMKITLGLGHKILGPEWTFGEWGELLRRCLSDDESRWPKDQGDINNPRHDASDRRQL